MDRQTDRQTIELNSYQKAAYAISCRVTRPTATITLQLFYNFLDFVRDNPGELVPEETFTHSHLSWSSIILIHGILPLQFACLIVFFHNLSKFSLVYLFACNPPLHTPYISSPNHCLLSAAHAHTIATCFAVVPKLCNLILVSLSTVS